jgi:hypothetical protein
VGSGRGPGREVRSFDDKEGFSQQEKVNIGIVTSTRSYSYYCCWRHRQSRQEQPLAEMT